MRVSIDLHKGSKEDVRVGDYHPYLRDGFDDGFVTISVGHDDVTLHGLSVLELRTLAQRIELTATAAEDAAKVTAHVEALIAAEQVAH